MSQEAEIIAKIEALGLFAKVRYIVAEADPDTIPTELPLCVLQDGGTDFEDLQTFCGSELFIQRYTMVIMANTAAEVRDLTVAVSTALKGIVGIDGSVRSYDPELRVYSAEVDWS